MPIVTQTYTRRLARAKPHADRATPVASPMPQMQPCSGNAAQPLLPWLGNAPCTPPFLACMPAGAPTSVAYAIPPKHLLSPSKSIVHTTSTATGSADFHPPTSAFLFFPHSSRSRSLSAPLRLMRQRMELRAHIPGISFIPSELSGRAVNPSSANTAGLGLLSPEHVCPL